MKKSFILFVSTLLFLPASFAADSPKVQLEKAREEAAKGKKDLLLVFSGPAWEPQSKEFEEKVLKADRFQKGLEKDFVQVVINIPRTREEAHKDLLEFEKTYQFRSFPAVILTDSLARPYANAVKVKMAPDEFLKELKNLRKVREERDATMAAAMKAKGLKQAELLVKALKNLPQDSIPAFYEKELKMIEKADPKDETNYVGAIRKDQEIAKEQARYNELFAARKYDEIIKASRTEAGKLKGEDAQRVMMYEVKALYAQKKYDEALKSVETLKKLAPESEMGKRTAQFTAQINGAKTRAEKMKEAAKKPKAPVVSKPVAIVTDINQLRKDAKKAEEELAQAQAMEKELAKSQEELAKKVSAMEAEMKALQSKAKASAETLKKASEKREKLARKAKAMKEVVENHEAMEKRKREISELEKRAADLQKQADELRKKAGEIRKGK